MTEPREASMAHVRQGVDTKKGTPFDVTWKDADGKPCQKRFYGDRDKAVAYAGKIEAELARGANTDPRAGRLTWGVVADEWLATRTRAKADTVAKYRTLLDTHTRAWSARPIAGIRPGDVGKLSLGLRADTRTGRARRPAGIERIMYPVRAVLAYAVAEGYLPRDPARKVDNPDAQTLGVEPFEGTALEPCVLGALALACGQKHEHGELIVWFDGLTGLRAGELEKLNIGDVVASARYLNARMTKNGKSRRVDYSGALADRLDKYLASHPRAGDASAPLFYGRDNNGRPDAARRFDAGTFYKRVFKPCARAAGLPALRLHDLRHTAGSWWLEAGVSLETVSLRLGHADINFTRRTYIHALHTRVAEDAARLDAWLEKQAETGERPEKDLRA